MSNLGAEVVALIITTNLVVIAVEPAAALDILPVSAGLSGSIVAGLKAHFRSPGEALPSLGAGRWLWIPTVVSGATAAVFAAPALAELVGWHELRSIILMHFLVGLLGSTLCDEVLSRSQSLSRLFVGRGVDAILPTRRKGDGR